MTTQNELRDRIAKAIAGEEEYPHPKGYTAHAQAIIDDHGLTVEHGAAYSEVDVHETRDRDESESMARWNTGMYRVERVVGKWEEKQ